MKIVTIKIFALSLFSCTSIPNNNLNIEGENRLEYEEFESSIISNYQSSEELKCKLIAEGIDTVIIFKRTCTGCCDFYNVFWQNGENTFIQKFYYDIEKGRNFTIRQQIDSDNVFEIVQTNYTDLRQEKLRESSHFLKREGDIIIVLPDIMTSHYCYSLIKIYSHNDSVISGQLKDTHFNMFMGVSDENGNPILNDNFEWNIKSDWYSLLTALEYEIHSMKETSSREHEKSRNERINLH